MEGSGSGSGFITPTNYINLCGMTRKQKKSIQRHKNVCAVLCGGGGME
jgi:hypothetical protein